MGDAASLGLVRLEYVAFGNAVADEADLPAEVIAILHRDIHTLASFRRVRVHGVAGEKEPLVDAELRANSLANLIGGPPVAVVINDLVRVEDLLSGLEDGVWRDLCPVSATGGVGADFSQLDIQAR